LIIKVENKRKGKKMEKTVKKVCQCQNCGNESEMIITCSLPEEIESDTDVSVKKEAVAEEKKVKGSAVCTHCGNEADMWVDY
jgi:ribosomal protein S14